MRARTGSVLSILLLLSVALNLFFGSQVAGRALRHAGGPPEDRFDDRGPPPPGRGGPERDDDKDDKKPPPPIAAMLERLPEADRPKARQVFLAHHPEIRAKAKALRDAGTDIARVSRNDPVQIQEFRAVFDAQRARWDELHHERQDTFLEALQALSPEGQRALIEATPALRGTPR